MLTNVCDLLALA